MVLQVLKSSQRGVTSYHQSAYKQLDIHVHTSQAEGSTATHETGSLHSVPNGTELYFQHKNQFVLQVVVTPIRGDATVYGVHVNWTVGRTGS